MIEPRLATLPDSDTRRLAIRADRYLAEVDLSLAFQAANEGDDERSERHRIAAQQRLERTAEIARSALEIVRNDSEFTAEVGLCLAYLAKAMPEGDGRKQVLVDEAVELLQLAEEQREGSGRAVLQRKLAKELGTDET